MSLIFDSEEVETCRRQILQLSRAHADEAGLLPAERLAVSMDRYRMLEDAGQLRIFTARYHYDLTAPLVAYNVFVVGEHPHFGALTATQELLYVVPSHRTESLRFMRWVDAQLEGERIELILRTSTAKKPYASVLKRMGYVPEAVVHLLRLPRA